LWTAEEDVTFGRKTSQFSEEQTEPINYSPLPSGIHRKARRAGVLCIGVEGDGKLHVDPSTDVGMLTQDDHGNFSDASLTSVFEAGDGGASQDIRLHQTQLST